MIATFTLLGVLVRAPQPEEYVQAREQIQAALSKVKRGASTDDIAALEAALQGLRQHAHVLADDEQTLRERELAMLAVVYANLTQGDEQAAELAMDEVLRLAMGKELPVRSFGPNLVALYDARNQTLTALGTANIDVECRVPCQVLIDEQHAPERSGALLLGSYRVVVEASDGGGEPRPLRMTVELGAAGDRERIVFGEFEPHAEDSVDDAAGDQPVVEGDDPEPTPPAPHVEPPADDAPIDGPVELRVPRREPRATRERLLPRYAELLGVGAGAGLMIAGAVLLGLDGKCPDLSRLPTGPDACPFAYNTDPVASYSLLGAGAAVLGVGGVLLSVDEVRSARGQRARELSVGWRLRF